jgi:chemotaxis protein methyltransferase CheR
VSEPLNAVAELVRRRTGVVVKDAQLPALAAALGRIAPEMDAKRFAAEIGETPRGPLLHALIDEVTVQETYFLREQRELEAIDWQGLLAAARERGSGVIRLWVAACSTGEEAYSLAILASEAFGRAAPPVTILATDISNAALARAEAGSGYSERSVRNVSQRLRERYLSREQGHYRVKDQLKALVRFRHHNLIEDSSPPPGEVPFDVVSCRNVLIYFDLPTVGRVLSSLETAMRPGGRLILGAADRLSGPAGGLGNVVSNPTVERRQVRPKRSLRRPLGIEPGPRRRSEDRIEDALLAANEDDLDGALEIVEALLAADPTLADAHFVRGLVELESGDSGAAAASLRTALYIDPSFGLAAFELGRAHDANGDVKAARRAYGQALRSLDVEDDRHRAILDQIDLGDVAAACAACAARLHSDRGAAP